MKSLMYAMILLMAVCVNLPIVAQEEDEINFPGKDRFCFRLSVGWAGSLLDLDYDNDAVVNGAAAEIDKENERSGFGEDTVAVSIGFKYALPVKEDIPFEYFSLGMSVDYNLMSIDDIHITTTAANPLKYAKDVADLHVVSFIAFIEGRYPIKAGNSWIAPFLRIGAGININISDNQDVFDVSEMTFAAMGAAGVEFFPGGENLGVFLEVKGHYNSAEFDLQPASSNHHFDGEIELSYIAVMVGINFYLGG